MSVNLHALPGNSRTFKALVAAEYSGKKVTQTDFKLGTTNKTNEFLALNPLGKVPVLTEGKESLFESNAIAYYLSNKQLKGETELNQAKVIQWLCFSDNELQPAVASYVFPYMGIIKVPQTVQDAGKSELTNLTIVLDKFLLTRTYLVGDRVTLADIVVTLTLLPAFTTVLDADSRKAIPNLVRYFTTIVNQPQVKKVVGDIKLNDKVGKSTFTLAAAAPKKETAAAAAPKKEEKKKAPKKGDDGDAEEEDEMAEFRQPESKNPMDAFPKGTFVMDDWKRFYSNNPEDQAIDYFWKHFDKENYSIWVGEYKYPEELNLVFMTCNLMSGMMQRLDKLRKHAFGSLLLFGEDGKNTISQLWIWRGHELAFKLHDDWAVDYDSYTWRKVDADAPECKTLVKEYFTWEGDFGGRKFNQGKIFK